MPIPTSPNEKFWLMVDSDKAADMPEEDKPAFAFRFLSGRQQREMAVMFDAMEAAEKSVEAIDKTYDILRFVLSGWRNVKVRGKEVPYSPDAAEDVMQFGEAQELVYRVWAYKPSPQDLGFCVSQSSTPSGEFVSPEPAAEETKTESA